MMKCRIAVVGSGAIGSYYGGKLAAAGRDVHFLMRGDLSDVRRHGLRLIGPDEDVRIDKVQCANTTDEIGPCDLVLITVKTTSNAALPALLPPLLHEGTLFLTLQNGLGNEELLARHFGAERVLGGLCFICLTRASTTRIERADHGHVSLGEFNRPALPRTHEVAALFTHAGVQCAAVDDLALERWRKLVWNIPFNGLSIVAGEIDTAAILRDAELRGVAWALMEEVIEAAKRCGYPLENDAAAEQMRRTDTMGAYKPSTLLDLQAGRPLEIETIWGEPLRRARAVGAATPRLELLYAALKSLDDVTRGKTAARAGSKA